VFGEAFTLGNLQVAQVTVAANTTVATLTTVRSGDGVAFTPTFVLVGNKDYTDAGYTITSSATVLTFTRAASTAADVLFVIAGILE